VLQVGDLKVAVCAQMAEFTKQLRDLQTQLHMNRQPVTIVTGQTSNKGYATTDAPYSHHHRVTGCCCALLLQATPTHYMHVVPSTCTGACRQHKHTWPCMLHVAASS
jgi:hypothetical protein